MIEHRCRGCGREIRYKAVGFRDNREEVVELYRKDLVVNKIFHLFYKLLEDGHASIETLDTLLNFAAFKFGIRDDEHSTLIHLEETND